MSSRILFVFCLLLCGCDSFVRPKLYPGSVVDAALHRLDASPDYDLISFERSDGKLREYYFRDIAESNDIMIYLHGNAISAAQQTLAFPASGFGLDVAVLEYSGYDAVDGRPSNRQLELDATSLIDELRHKHPDARIILAGTSLGGTLAIITAAERDVDALITFAAFTNTTDFVPAWARPALFFRHRFNAVGNAKKVAAPWIIAHCLEDPDVPSEMAMELAAAQVRAGQSPDIRLLPCAEHDVPVSHWYPIINDVIGQMASRPKTEIAAVKDE